MTMVKVHPKIKFWHNLLNLILFKTCDVILSVENKRMRTLAW